MATLYIRLSNLFYNMAGSFGFQTSSFQRRNKSAVQIVGTKISAVNSSLHVSTGVGSLDDVIGNDGLGRCSSSSPYMFNLLFSVHIGGGLPLGSLCLIGDSDN